MSYLSLRACIGLWTAFLCIVLVATDASSLVCYITRFTEEAFAALICIIFIYEALEKLLQLREAYPINTHTDLDNLTLYRYTHTTLFPLYCRAVWDSLHLPWCFFCSCQCSAPSQMSNETLQLWNSTGHTTDSIPWNHLNVTVSIPPHLSPVTHTHSDLYIPTISNIQCILWQWSKDTGWKQDLFFLLVYSKKCQDWLFHLMAPVRDLLLGASRDDCLACVLV